MKKVITDWTELDGLKFKEYRIDCNRNENFSVTTNDSRHFNFYGFSDEFKISFLQAMGIDVVKIPRHKFTNAEIAFMTWLTSNSSVSYIVKHKQCQNVDVMYREDGHLTTIPLTSKLFCNLIPHKPYLVTELLDKCEVLT